MLAKGGESQEGKGKEKKRSTAATLGSAIIMCHQRFRYLKCTLELDVFLTGSSPYTGTCTRNNSRLSWVYLQTHYPPEKAHVDLITNSPYLLKNILIARPADQGKSEHEHICAPVAEWPQPAVVLLP